MLLMEIKCTLNHTFKYMLASLYMELMLFMEVLFVVTFAGKIQDIKPVQNAQFLHLRNYELLRTFNILLIRLQQQMICHCI